MATNTVKTVSLQPKVKAIMMQPKRLRKATKTMPMLMPSNCWSCVGSLPTRAARVPLELSSESKNGIGFASIESKYCWRYVHAMFYCKVNSYIERRKTYLTTEIACEDAPRVK